MRISIFGVFLFGFCQRIFAFSSSSSSSSSGLASSSSSLVTVVSSCTSTLAKTRRVNLHCADGHIRVLKAFVGSLEDRLFGCFHHSQDCVADQQFPYCDGGSSCDVDVPKQKPILCTRASNDHRRIYSMSAYLQISYECVGKRPRKKSVCLSGPTGESIASSASCSEGEHLQILNVFEGRKNYAKSQALSVMDPTSACVHRIGDEVFRSPLSASFSLGCNGLRECRLPTVAAAVSSSSFSYFQVYFACSEGESISASRCVRPPPNSLQDQPHAKRYLGLDCSSSSSSRVIVILNAFFGSRESAAVDATSCSLQSKDVVLPTDVQTCDGRRRCFVSLKDQLQSHLGHRPLYLQVHYRCVDSTPMKLDLIPSSSNSTSSISLRDYPKNGDEINAATKTRSDGGAAGKSADIDHTSTIVGGVLCTAAVISAFVIAYVLNRKWQRRERLNSARNEGEEEALTIDDGGSAAANTSAEKTESFAETNAASERGEVKKSQEQKVSSGVATLESLMDLTEIADARLRSNQSPTLPRKLDHLPEECRKSPPANVVDIIEKGEKREFYV